MCHQSCQSYRFLARDAHNLQCLQDFFFLFMTIKNIRILHIKICMVKLISGFLPVCICPDGPAVTARDCYVRNRRFLHVSTSLHGKRNKKRKYPVSQKDSQVQILVRAFGKDCTPDRRGLRAASY